MQVILDGIIYSLQRQGGISVYFDELRTHLAESGVDHRVLLFGSAFNGSRAEFGQGRSYRARVFERYRKCPIEYRNTEGSVFHSSYYRIPSRQMPSVVTVHDFVYEKYISGPARIVHNWQKGMAIDRASAIICISESTKKDLLKFFPHSASKRIFVIPNGVSEVFQRDFDVIRDRSLILFVGKRDGYKNFTTLAKALCHLPTYRLVCIGGGPISEGELAEISEDVACRISYGGLVSSSELNRYYNMAHCLVYPSLYEGFGLPVIEAMRAGCPVVSSNCEAVVEVGGEALTIAADMCPESLAAAVRKLEDPEYYKQHVESGYTRSAYYSWKRCHSATLEVYRSVSEQIQ